MASEKILEVKKQQQAELREKLLSMGSVILVDYRGLTVAQDTAMRSDMKKADIEYKVIKYRLLLNIFSITTGLRLIFFPLLH
jgi:large subunit ribosomal protein L10